MQKVYKKGVGARCKSCTRTGMKVFRKGVMGLGVNHGTGMRVQEGYIRWVLRLGIHPALGQV